MSRSKSVKNMNDALEEVRTQEERSDEDVWSESDEL